MNRPHYGYTPRPAHDPHRGVPYRTAGSMPVTPGTVLLVSHDRHLIRSVAHDLLEVRNGVVKLHSGVEESVLSPSFSGGTAGPGVKAAPTPPPRQQKTATAVKKEKKAAQAASSQQRKPGGGPAVKELRKNVARIEKALAAAETEVADLNRQLADPEVFSDHEKAAELGRQFGEAKDRSLALMDEWTDASVALERAGG